MDEGLKRNLIIAFAVVAIAVCLYAVVRGFGEDPVVKSANTGRMTLYPTEVCWRGECGQRGGTHVILNTWLDVEGPTRCPVCGSTVRVHNPGPRQPPEEE